MTKLRPILLAEDNLKDVELVLAALKKDHLANEVVVARDGARPWTTSTGGETSVPGRTGFRSRYFSI